MNDGGGSVSKCLVEVRAGTADGVSICDNFAMYLDTVLLETSAANCLGDVRRAVLARVPARTGYDDCYTKLVLYGNGCAAEVFLYRSSMYRQKCVGHILNYYEGD